MESKVLVVDDEKDIRDFLNKALTRFGGFQIELASTGEEALNHVNQNHFDLVLTDLKMPKLNGLELVSEISKSKPEIITVLMTGHGSIDSALEAMKLGASDYLTKPINLDELVIRLRKALEERQRFVSLKGYAKELEKANLELRKIDEIKSEFVSVASHELRTPLAAIKNAVQLILSGKTGEINDNQTKFLSMADRNINRLSNILNDLLDLSRIESGKIEMKFEEFDPSMLIEFVLFSLKPQADKKSIRLKMDVPEIVPLVYGDRGKVEQILTNLIGNAVKFTPEGGEILLSAKPHGPREHLLAIAVKDTGIGIPQDQINKVFDKFYQVEGSLQRSESGTGLGLAITKGLVEAGHGTIWAESEVGKGSTFTFTIPVLKGERRDLCFRATFNREFQRVQENHLPLSIFLIDIGDEPFEVKEGLLTSLQERVKKCLYRKEDTTLIRKKDRILTVLCHADLKGAQAIRLRIKGELEKNPLKWEEQSLPIKIGFATYPDEAASKRGSFRKAKERLGG